MSTIRNQIFALSSRASSLFFVLCSAVLLGPAQSLAQTPGESSESRARTTYQNSHELREAYRHELRALEGQRILERQREVSKDYQARLSRLSVGSVSTRAYLNQQLRAELNKAKELSKDDPSSPVNRRYAQVRARLEALNARASGRMQMAHTNAQANFGARAQIAPRFEKAYRGTNVAPYAVVAEREQRKKDLSPWNPVGPVVATRNPLLAPPNARRMASGSVMLASSPSLIQLFPQQPFAPLTPQALPPSKLQTPERSEIRLASATRARSPRARPRSAPRAAPVVAAAVVTEAALAEPTAPAASQTTSDVVIETENAEPKAQVSMISIPAIPEIEITIPELPNLYADAAARIEKENIEALARALGTSFEKIMANHAASAAQLPAQVQIQAQAAVSDEVGAKPFVGPPVEDERITPTKASGSAR